MVSTSTVCEAGSSVVARVLVQDVSTEDDIPFDAWGHEERVLDNGLTN